MRMADVALATAAAPPIYRACASWRISVDRRGVWANEPDDAAVVEAMICYDVPRDRIKVLRIGCGDEAYHVKRRMT